MDDRPIGQEEKNPEFWKKLKHFTSFDGDEYISEFAPNIR